MVVMLAALLVAPQPGSLAEAGVYDCMAGEVSLSAPLPDTAPRLDRRFAVTVHGLRFIESDGTANDDLVPGEDFVITDPTAILGESGELRVAFDAAGNLVVGREREVTLRAGAVRNWYVLRGARGPDSEVRGLCYLDREWTEGAIR